MELTKAFIFVLLGGLGIRGAFSYMRVCYYTNWSQFEPTYRISPSRIPAQLCTHIVFAYADIRANNVTTTEFNDVEMYGRLNRLKRESPSLQVILAVGGWAAGGDKFSRLVSSENSMEQFTDNLVSFLRRHSLDGVNIDWQYPTSRDRGSDVVDRQRFTNFLQILQRGFSDEATTTGRVRLSLSASLESDLEEARSYYQIDEIGKVLDFASLMAYDMHGDWDRTSGAQHHSPLEPEIRTQVQGWIQAGFPADKLVVAISGSGRSFTLTSEPVGNGVGQQVTGGGTAGVVSKETGLLDYGEICSNIARDGWTRVWLQDRGVPIAYSNSSDGWQWVGYDDPQSLSEKAAFIRRLGLAGAAFWSLEHDDFNSLCQNGTWPLLRALTRELPNNSTPPPTTSTRPPTSSATTARKTTTPSPRLSATSSSLSPNMRTTSFNITSTTPGALAQRDKDRRTNKDARLNDQVGHHPGSANLGPKLNQSDMSSEDDQGDTETEYQQCKVSDSIGSALTCPSARGKPGDKNTFFLFCSSGFFAIECRCLPGHFFNRCLQTCDVNENFRKCPQVN